MYVSLKLESTFPTKFTLITSAPERVSLSTSLTWLCRANENSRHVKLSGERGILDIRPKGVYV